MNLRAKASHIIFQVIVEGRSLSDSLANLVTKDSRDSAFIQAICYGVCRFYERLAAILQLLLDKPLKEKDRDIYCLLLVGLYQLSEMRVAPHAAIAETVNATKVLKKPWAKNLVNAILRQYQRHPELSANIQQKEAEFAHPLWIIKKIQKAWPNDWEAILTANIQHPPFSLRINQKKTSRDNYLRHFHQAHVIAETDSGMILPEPVPVETLPGFSAGEVSVQDGAAQLAAGLLNLKPGLKVLDACAAPGGKTTHILENESSIQLTAIDHDEKRLDSIRDNLKRLELTADCLCNDASTPQEWWNGVQYDRILLDVPCSASGVIRRHPDIKILRREEDIAKLAAVQAKLLDAIWPLLAPGGLLLYATCSIFPEENSDLVQAFLETHADAREERIESGWGKKCLVGKQILPGMHDMDGFYYARLNKMR